MEDRYEGLPKAIRLWSYVVGGENEHDVQEELILYPTWVRFSQSGHPGYEMEKRWEFSSVEPSFIKEAKRIIAAFGELDPNQYQVGERKSRTTYTMIRLMDGSHGNPEFSFFGMPKEAVDAKMLHALSLLASFLPKGTTKPRALEDLA